MNPMKHFAAALLMASLPMTAFAASDVQLADNNTNPPRFFPLDGLHNGQLPMVKTVPTTAHTDQPLRSDKAALNDGFFRIDRSSIMVMPKGPTKPLVLKTDAAHADAGDAPHVIEGAGTAPALAATSAPAAGASTSTSSSNPVLSLFGAQGNEKVASFRDSLRKAVGGGQASAPVAHQNWPLPVDSKQRLSSGYGYRIDPVSHEGEQFHKGIDIAAPVGTPVLASNDGQVSKVGTEGPYGQSITILHADGSETSYGHLSAQKVSVGQHVKAGQQIGAVGATGRVTGPHLDYRITQGGLSLDPMSVLTPPVNVADASTDNATTAPQNGVQVDNGPVTNPATRPRVPAKSERLIVVR